MVKRKIVKIGNSAGVIIPREILQKAGWKVGDEVMLTGEPGEGPLLLYDQDDSTYKSKITPEFKQWLDEFTKKHKDLLKELARV